MRYGENSHQQAAFYIEENAKAASAATAQQVQGKHFPTTISLIPTRRWSVKKSSTSQPGVIVKHANPRGVAQVPLFLDAYDRAYKTDPTSAFGGIIASNRELDAETAQAIISPSVRVEAIIAPIRV